VKTLAVEFPVAQACQLLGLSRSGYYAWLKRKLSKRESSDRKLLPVIIQVHQESRGSYGSPRVAQELKRRQHGCGRHRVARLMRRSGLRGLQKRSFRPQTTDSKHGLAIAPNRLKQQPEPTAPDRTWVADITYIATVQGWLYLAVVMDLYSRRVVGWALAHHLKSSLPQQALSRALRTRRPCRGLLHHSDRGIQYASRDYRSLLESNQLLCSMSARGNCYDNAAMESFFSTLKTELLHRRSWRGCAEVRLALFDYIETFYNRRRLHSALNYQSPSEFEAHAQN
jgi:transposase InsO family protein